MRQATVHSEQIGIDERERHEIPPAGSAAASGAAAGAGGWPKGIHLVPVIAAAPRDHWAVEAAYRALEIAIALAGLIVGLPIMAVEALLVKWETPGPAIFIHRRTWRSRLVAGRELAGRREFIAPPEGLHPERLYYVPTTFNFPKIRTMYTDARARFPELYRYQLTPAEFHELPLKHADDPRITPLGRYLRRLTIDELPNLWCVLKGSMRLVGPRPENPDVVHCYYPQEMYKFSVTPGITGLAQTSGRGLLKWGQLIECDLEYIRTRSVALDLKIIAKTLWLVIRRHGAM